MSDDILVAAVISLLILSIVLGISWYNYWEAKVRIIGLEKGYIQKTKVDRLSFGDGEYGDKVNVLWVKSTEE